MSYRGLMGGGNSRKWRLVVQRRRSEQRSSLVRASIKEEEHKLILVVLQKKGRKPSNTSTTPIMKARTENEVGFPQYKNDHFMVIVLGSFPWIDRSSSLLSINNSLCFQFYLEQNDFIPFSHLWEGLEENGNGDGSFIRLQEKDNVHQLWDSSVCILA